MTKVNEEEIEKPVIKITDTNEGEAANNTAKDVSSGHRSFLKIVIKVVIVFTIIISLIGLITIILLAQEGEEITPYTILRKLKILSEKTDLPNSEKWKGSNTTLLNSPHLNHSEIMVSKIERDGLKIIIARFGISSPLVTFNGISSPMITFNITKGRTGTTSDSIIDVDLHTTTVRHTQPYFSPTTSPPTAETGLPNTAEAGLYETRRNYSVPGSKFITAMAERYPTDPPIGEAYPDYVSPPEPERPEILLHTVRDVTETTNAITAMIHGVNGLEDIPTQEPVEEGNYYLRLEYNTSNANNVNWRGY